MSNDDVIDLTLDSSPEITPVHVVRPGRGSSPQAGPSVPRRASPPEADAGDNPFVVGQTRFRARPAPPPRIYAPRIPGPDDDVIDLVLSSEDEEDSDVDADLDDDDVLDLDDGDANPHVVPARPRGREFRQNLARIDAALYRAGRQERLILEQELAEIREASNPPPPPPLVPAGGGGGLRIGLGGAVFRNGNRELRFAPNVPTGLFQVNEVGDTEEVNAPTRRAPRRGVRDLHGHMPAFLRADAEGLQVDAQAAAAAALERMNVAAEARAQALEEARAQRAARLATGPQWVRLQILGGPMGMAGRAFPVQDPAAIIAKVAIEAVPPAKAGFAKTWDLDDIETSLAAPTPIELDDSGHVIKKRAKAKVPKPYLSCANCPEPLRVSSAARDDADRVWALQCGHIMDERCLHALSAPPAAPLLEPSPKKRKTNTRSKKNAEHTWNCPACARPHVAVQEDGKWVQKDGFGGTLLFV